VLDEIQRLRSEKVAEPELAAAKRSIASSFALSLEDPNELLNYLIASRVYGYSGDYWDRYPAKIMEVTAEEVQRVIQKYLNPDRLQITAVGDAKKILPALRKFGLIEIYDTEGKSRR
jgi:predicted Zn-dependent peptidase